MKNPNKVKVLWVDDEWKDEDLKNFRNIAADNGISLVCKEDEESALLEIDNNKEEYDAVILDANFKKTSKDYIENKKGQWLITLGSHIKTNTDLPVFVFSGKIYNNSEKFDQDNIEVIEKIFGKERIYTKGTHRKKLIQDLLNFKDIKLKKTYKEVFEACVDIGNGSDELLLSLLLQMENNLEINITSIRKLMENVFDSYKKKELAPHDLNDSGVSMFICGVETSNNNRNRRYKIKESQQLPGLMANTERALWFLANGGSHNPDSRDKRNNPEKLLSNRYARKGMIMFLCEFLVFVKKFFDQNPEKGQWAEV